MKIAYRTRWDPEPIRTQAPLYVGVYMDWFDSVFSHALKYQIPSHKGWQAVKYPPLLQQKMPPFDRIDLWTTILLFDEDTVATMIMEFDPRHDNRPYPEFSDLAPDVLVMEAQQDPGRITIPHGLPRNLHRGHSRDTHGGR